MTRKIILVIAALVLPGGLLMLLGAWALQKTRRGRQVLALAQSRAPAWATSFGFTAVRQQAA